MIQVLVKEVAIEEVVKLGSEIVEFGENYESDFFTSRYGEKKKLIIVAYIDGKAAGYIVAYDKFNNDSFYCWMAGVSINFRRKGVLKALMDYQYNWAKKEGYSKITITTRNTRRKMLSYLVNYGFNLTKVDSYDSVEENRIHLEKGIK